MTICEHNKRKYDCNYVMVVIDVSWKNKSFL